MSIAQLEEVNPTCLPSLPVISTFTISFLVFFSSISAALLQLTKKALHCILDELVYKLSSTINLILGSIAVNLLLFIAEFDPQLLTTLVTRYKGLLLCLLEIGEIIK